MTDVSQTAPALTRRQHAALRLLGRGGARYGTMIAEVKRLRDRGLAVAHDTGKPPPGRWTWRPTQLAKPMLAKLDSMNAD